MYLDTSYNYEYILTLCKPNKEPIQEMFDIFDFTFEAKFPTTDEISFRVSKKLDSRDNKLWDLIKGDYLIHVKIINDKESLNEKYFIINNIKENADDKTIKKITAYSLESELNKKIDRKSVV